MKTFLRDNGLAIALTAMFVFTLSGMMLSGHAAYNSELQDHNAGPLGDPDDPSRPDDELPRTRRARRPVLS